MRYQMFNYKSLLFLAVTIFLAGASAIIVPGLGSNGVVHAQTEFTNESFLGTYAVSSPTSVSAALGVVTADGNGNVTGSFIFNVPVPIRNRQIIPFTFDGTYVVNPDGTGFASVTGTDPDGNIMENTLDLVITEAEVQDDGVKLATEAFGVQREPGLLFEGREVITSLFKRLPD